MTALAFALEYALAIAAMAEKGLAIVEAARSGADMMRRMVNENRGPTADEQAWLNNLMLANQKAIDEAVERG